MTGDDGEGQRPPRPPRRGLTAEEFEALLAWLDPDRRKAGEVYVSVRRKLVRFFERRGCDIAEELADETINRAARRLAEGVKPQIVDHYSFFHGFAVRILKEHWRRMASEGRRRAELPPLPPADPDPEEEDQRRAWLEALRQCLARLSRDEQSLILRYYEGEDRIRSRQLFAAERGVTLNALRIHAHRVRRKVEACLQGIR